MKSEVVHQYQQDFMSGELVGCPWMEEGIAFDLNIIPSVAYTPDRAVQLAVAIQDMTKAIAQGHYDFGIRLDVFVQPAADREKRLFVADMDSTMIGQECIDELADYAGFKAEVAAITERAMQGELDFRSALAERVALLKGLDEAVIGQCIAERIRPNPGARTLVATLRARGIRTVLVSGGFTAFAGPIGADLGFDRVVANVLATEAGKLTGKTEGPVIDAEAKKAVLLEEAAALGVGPDKVIAIGDGANDIPMVEAAGLGIAYRAKPALVDVANARLDHHPLDALLWALGIPSSQWVTD